RQSLQAAPSERQRRGPKGLGSGIVSWQGLWVRGVRRRMSWAFGRPQQTPGPHGQASRKNAQPRHPQKVPALRRQEAPFLNPSHEMQQSNEGKDRAGSNEISLHGVLSG